MMHPTPPVTESVDACPGFPDLARLHPFILAWDENGSVVQASHGLTRLVGRNLVGSACETLLPHLATALPHESADEPSLVRDTALRLAGRQILVDVTVLGAHAAGLPDRSRLAILRVTQTGQDLEPATVPRTDFLTTVLDNAPDGAIAIDPSGFVIYANHALLEMTGLRRDELLHHPVASFFVRAGLSKPVKAWLRDRELQCDFNWEIPNSRRVVALQISSRHLILPGGEQVGHVAFVRDVTEGRRIRRELEEKNAELENYVNTVSHDLRSPLASLLGFSRLLRQDYQQSIDEMGHHFLDRIDQAGQTMEALIEDLLTISKIGELGIQRTWIDPSKVLEQLRAELKPQLEEKNISLQLPAAPPVVLCDRTRLYQIFSNLVGNAVRHGTNGIPSEIRIEIRKEDAAHVLSVHDNGQGIDPDHHERIFQVFQTVGRRDGDTAAGMGLAIVRKIATLHGGRAWVDSRPQHGASFHVSLPYS